MVSSLWCYLFLDFFKLGYYTRKCENGATIERSVGYYYTELREHVLVASLIKVLFTLARHCHSADHYVKLWWDYGH